MVDMTMFTGAAAALRSAGDIAKALIGLRDAAMIQEKVIELQTLIVTAQNNTLAAQAEQFSLLEKVRELEGKLADLEAWNQEKQRYELRQIAHGAFAYSLKPSAANGEPPHWLCTACFERRRKAHLQKQGVVGRDAVYKCADCKSSVTVPWSTHPGGGQ